MKQITFKIEECFGFSPIRKKAKPTLPCFYLDLNQS